MGNNNFKKYKVYTMIIMYLMIQTNNKLIDNLKKNK